MSAPLVDGREAAAVLADLLAALPGYTPEWTPSGRGPALALLRVIARDRHILNRALNRAPERGLLAFLDMLGTRLAPASAARVPLVFRLTEDAPLDVNLPAGSQVAAPPRPEIPPADAPASPSPPAESAVFATERAVTLSRSRLARLYSIEPGADRYADHSAALTQGFDLFGDLVPAEHALYLGHDRLFAFGGEITLLIGVSLSRGAAAPIDLIWEYLSESGWIPLQSPREDDTTGGLTASGQLVLRRACGPDAKKASFGGRASFWLRATSRSPVIPGMSALSLVMNDLNARVRFRKERLAPDAAFADFVKLDTSRDFHPFGAQPVLASAFYLACDEAFGRAGATIDIRFSLSSTGTTKSYSTPQTGGTFGLEWEISTDDGWEALEVSPTKPGFDFTTAAGSVMFTAPQRWADREVNGVKKRWLRARISGGDFGRPLRATGQLTNNQPTFDPGNLTPPVVQKVETSFEYLTDPEPLEHCVAFNDFVFQDHTEACRWPDRTFPPFRALSDPAPAVHLAFDKPFPVGLVSCYVQVSGEGAATQPISPYVWEYSTAAGWAELGVLDETCGFRQSGMVQFIAPPDAAPADGLGGRLYRLRARVKQGEAIAPARIAGIWANAAWAVHQRRIERELLGTSDGNPGQTLRFARSPVLEGEAIEIQEWTGRGEMWRTALEGVPETDLRFERNPATGLATAAWVRWHERPHLHFSTGADRHYAIERATGRVRFGARVPAAGKRIAATYSTGGGSAGNVPAGTARELRVAAPFIAGVDNPVAAAGGAATERIADVIRRGPQQVRHRDRALSAQDYEWLARDASPEVARSRCRPVVGPDGLAQRGWVTLLIVPRSSEARPIPGPELARRIRNFLVARCPAAVALRVQAPQYVPVSVAAIVTPEDPSQAAVTESRLRERLNRFLHPLLGGPAGDGWDFGEAVHLSQIAAVIEAVPGVDYASSIVLKSGATVHDALVPIAADALAVAGPHELVLRIGDR